MIFPPDRLSGLIARLEAGETVTQQDVDRLATLQALDVAKMGQDFARTVIGADDALTNDLRQQAAAL